MSIMSSAVLAASVPQIIGRVLLILLLVILGILLLILFIPIVFRAQIYKEENLTVNASVSWLFRFVYATVSYDADHSLQKQVRILGIPILSLLKKQKALSAKKKEREEDRKTEKRVAPVRPSIQPGERKSDQPIVVGQPEIIRPKRPTILMRIGARIAALIGKIRALTRKIRRIMKIIEDWLDYLQTEEFDRAFSVLRKHGGAIFKNVRPNQIRGEVIFGADDPAKTGETMAIVAMLGEVWPKKLRLTPDFMDKRLEADVRIGGHITVFKIVWHAIATILCKEVRKLIRRIRKRPDKASHKEMRKNKWQTTEKTMSFRTT